MIQNTCSSLGIRCAISPSWIPQKLKRSTLIQVICGAIITQSISSKILKQRHPITCPKGWGMGCLLLVQHLFDILPQFLQLLIQYLTTLDYVITALDCSWCHHYDQATSHDLCQCWSRFVSPYVITRPQWVNFGNVVHCDCCVTMLCMEIHVCVIIIFKIFLSYSLVKYSNKDFT